MTWVAWALKNWKYVTMAALAAAAVVMFGLWKMEEAGRAEDKLALEQAVRKAQEKAEALSNELIIEQARAMAATERTVIKYVDQIRSAPGDAERNRLGTLGVRDILRPGKPETK